MSAVLLLLLCLQDEFKISTDVNNVVLPVTVQDSRGGFVEGLSADDFKVYEDGRPQQICAFSNRDIPVTVGLVIDNSSSMTPRRDATNLAALHFVRLSHPDDEVFVVNFSDGVSFGLPADMPFTDDVRVLRAALSSERPHGKTALHDAILKALDHLERGRHDRKALVVVSDGGDTASRNGFEEVLRRARKSRAVVYAIGLFDLHEYDPDRRPGRLRKLARETGGAWFEPADSNAVFGAAARIARELRSQYTIAYVPDGTRQDSGYHRVQVVVERPHILVRTRQGYYAPAAAAQRSAR